MNVKYHGIHSLPESPTVQGQGRNKEENPRGKPRQSLGCQRSVLLKNSCVSRDACELYHLFMVLRDDSSLAPPFLQCQMKETSQSAKPTSSSKGVYLGFVGLCSPKELGMQCAF